MPLHFNKPTRATLTSVNPQSENHGPDELVPTLHLRFAVDAPAAVLGGFHPDLAPMLYTDAAAPSGLRFPKLGSLKWDEEHKRCRLGVDFGIEGEAEVLECRVHRIVVTCKPGGTVALEFTASCEHELSAHVVGLFGMLVKHALWITLSGGELVKEGDEGKQAALSLVPS
jgi:hypothetical protein